MWSMNMIYEKLRSTYFPFADNSVSPVRFDLDHFLDGGFPGRSDERLRHLD